MHLHPLETRETYPSRVFRLCVFVLVRYDGPSFKWRDLLTCYRHENGRVAPWEDERWPELAQNTGQLWVHEALAAHPRRTHDPAKADLFVVPLES